MAAEKLRHPARTGKYQIVGRNCGKGKFFHLSLVEGQVPERNPGIGEQLGQFRRTLAGAEQEDFFPRLDC